MADYTSIVKIEALHSLEIVGGFSEAANLGNFPALGALKGGFAPAVTFKYIKEGRRGTGQIYPRSL
tara:strand:- start:406 stop:603 length:198 start_codon:yes stop_codon:yes gene_type:complete